MNDTKKISTTLASPAFRKRFRDNLVEEARQTGTMLYYQDEYGRSVEEWPATGELYEVRYDVPTDTIIRLKALYLSELTTH